MSDLENENLSAHVALCQLRYEALTQKVDSTNSQMCELKDTMKSLKDTMEAHVTKTNNKEMGIATWLIGGLLAALGSIAIHLLFR
jgi:chromosome segregation ATPase